MVGCMFSILLQTMRYIERANDSDEYKDDVKSFIYKITKYSNILKPILSVYICLLLVHSSFLGFPSTLSAQAIFIIIVVGIQSYNILMYRPFVHNLFVVFV